MHGQGKDKYDNVRVGLNSRLDTLQAVILLNKLKIFDNELILRNKIAGFYSKNLKKYLNVPYVENLNKSAWAQYSLLIKDEKERDLLIKHLANHDIPVAIYYRKIFSELDMYKNTINNEFYISKKISKSIFSIPMHPYLSNNELNKIVKSISSFYK